MSSINSNKVILIINVDWYFLLHWKQRAKFLKRSGYEVIVCTKVTSIANKGEIKALGVELHEIDFVRHQFSPLTELRCLRDLWRVISKENLYLLHAITIKPILFIHLLGLFYGFRSIFAFPGLGHLAIKRNFLNWCVWRDFELAKLAKDVHEVAAYVIMGVIGLHVAGALKHAVVDRDGTLRRMTCGCEKKGD